MSYLRTNLRSRGRELDAAAIGGGINNWIQGSMDSPLNNRGPRFYGGMVMFSINEAQSGLMSLATDSILAQYYGATFVSNVLDGGAGFRVVPINVFNVTEMSLLYLYAPTFSFGTGSIVFIAARKTTMSTGPSEVILTLVAASTSHHIVCVGFISSTPFGPWS